ASLAAEAWVGVSLLPNQPLLGVILIALLALPGLVGVVLVIAAVVEATRTTNTWRARRRLLAQAP
ncbi:MAG: hypothetical protein ACO1SX_02670, partial [Actinomycetota bacterium]